MRYIHFLLVFIAVHLNAQQTSFLNEYRTGANPVSDEGAGIQKLSDGYILGGNRDPLFTSNYDFQLIKINTAGNVVWSYSYDLGGSEILSHVRQTTDGGFFMYGSQGADVIVIKTNSSGTPSWAWRFAGMSTVEPSKCREETVNPNGGYILAGAEIGLGSGGGFRDGYLIRLTAGGALRWAVAYGLNTREDFFNDMAEDNNGRWSVAASYGIGASSQSVWFLIDSTALTIKRQREINIGGIDYLSASYVNTNSSIGAGKYFLAGRTGTNMYLVRTCDGCTGNLTNTRYSRSISVNDGAAYSTEIYSVDSVPGENALWMSGKIYGAIAVNGASLEQDFLFVKVNMSAVSPFAPTTIASSVAIGTATYNEIANEGTIVSANECVAIGTNTGDPMSPGASYRIKVAQSSVAVNCEYRDLTSVTSIAASGASAAGSSPAITDITASITTTSIPLGSITITDLLAGTVKSQNCFTTQPVTLLSFSGKQENKAVRLNWITASEDNNSYFTIERSTDGKIYSEIGSMPGAGNSNVNQYYTFTDESPAAENYYRLSQTDFDGHKEEVGFLAVKMNASSGELSVIILPGLSGNDREVSLQIQSPVDDRLAVSVSDIHGKKIIEEVNTVLAGENHFLTIPLAGSSNGLYLIGVTGRYGSANAKFILSADK